MEQYVIQGVSIFLPPGLLYLEVVMKMWKSIFCLAFLLMATRIPFVRAIILVISFIAFVILATQSLRKLIPMTPAKIELVMDDAPRGGQSAYGNLIADITLLVRQEEPEAKWIWALPGSAKRSLLRGDETKILVYYAAFTSAKVRIDPATHRITSFVTDSEDQDEIACEFCDPEAVAHEWFTQQYQAVCERIGEIAPEGHSLQLRPDELPGENSWSSIVAQFVKEQYGAEIIDGHAGIMLYF